MRLTLFAMFLLLAACGNDRTAGTGSQTGNSLNSVVAGRLLKSDSTTPDEGDTVLLKTSDWTGNANDATPRTSVTDSLGRFHFEDVPAGTWILQSCERRDGWMRTLHVFADQDTVLPDGVRAEYGSLVVTISLNDSLKHMGTIFVLGFADRWPLSAAGAAKSYTFRIDDLPPGKRRLVVRDNADSVLLEAEGHVQSDMVDSVKEWEIPDGDEGVD